VIPAAPLGKTKTVTQVVAVTLLILQRPYPWLGLPATLAVAFAVLFTLSSGLDYLWRWRHILLPGGSREQAPAPAPSGGAPGAESPMHPRAVELGALLKERGLTLALAESCTGGLVAELVTDVPGSSAYFLGGVVAYSDQSKREQLGVEAGLLEHHGAVSEPVAIAMAEGARSRFRSSLAAGITGIAGPDSEGSTKPVGLTYIAIASSVACQAHRFLLEGDRWRNRRQAAEEALRLLAEAGRTLAAGEVKKT
jgi:PncC family amidohydrolase